MPFEDKRLSTEHLCPRNCAAEKICSGSLKEERGERCNRLQGPPSARPVAAADRRENMAELKHSLRERRGRGRKFVCIMISRHKILTRKQKRKGCYRVRIACWEIGGGGKHTLTHMKLTK